MPDGDITVVIDQEIDLVIREAVPSDTAILAQSSIEEKAQTELVVVQSVVAPEATAEKVTLSLGPEGPRGPDGPSGPIGATGLAGKNATIDVVGLASGRSVYDAEKKNFAYLEEDTNLLFIKKTDTAGDWSLGQPYGVGPQGPQGPAGEYSGPVIWVDTFPGSAKEGDILLYPTADWS